MASSKKKTKGQANNKKRQAAKALERRRALMAGGPVTLEQAKALVQARAPRHAVRRQGGPLPAASPGSVGAERKKLELQRRRENERRIREYKATLEIMKRRGVKGLSAEAPK